MKEKEKQIIETGMKLFAQQGYVSTSIQEIADATGIAKGSFYSYFKSKDALLLAIFTYYVEDLLVKMRRFESEEVEPRDKFKKQLTSLLETLIEHKDFIVMQTREQALPLNQEIREVVFSMQIQGNLFFRQAISDIYGEEIEPYVWDFSLIAEGICHSYLRLLMFTDEKQSIPTLASFILQRLDDLYHGFVSKKDAPYFSSEKAEELLQSMKSAFLGPKNQVTATLQEMRKEIEKLDNQADLLVALEVLEEELHREAPRAPVIQGMLSHFQDDPRFRQHIISIQSTLA